MTISVGDETFAVPLNFIERAIESGRAQITTSGKQELIKVDDDLVPLMRLNRVLELPDKSEGTGAVIVVRLADRRMAIWVDAIVGKQDIVVKPLGAIVGNQPLFSGATLSGDGKVILILDLPNLIQSDASVTAQSQDWKFEAEEEAAPSVPRILVVDDSLSVRKVVEKHIIALGYEVELATDGLDALDKLRNGTFSLVLSDLEMPRMHGFELIAEMRRQDALADLPVIVVTSRDAEKHRVKASSLGANDYIIKPFSREQLSSHIAKLLGITA